MPAERTTMRQVHEVLGLKFVGRVPNREIAGRIGVAASTVRATLRRLRTAGLIDRLTGEVRHPNERGGAICRYPVCYPIRFCCRLRTIFPLCW
jgi:DNA-binding Lrp family transcriptional regulator